MKTLISETGLGVQLALREGGGLVITVPVNNALMDMLSDIRAGMLKGETGLACSRHKPDDESTAFVMFVDKEGKAIRFLVADSVIESFLFNIEAQHENAVLHFLNSGRPKILDYKGGEMELYDDPAI